MSHATSSSGDWLRARSPGECTPPVLHLRLARRPPASVDRSSACRAVRGSHRETGPVREPSADWVALSPRFTSGWPWAEDSYGLGPIYRDDGWCRGCCGTPLVEQSGALVIQGSKLPSAEVWMPNWLFDVVCVSAAMAYDIEGRFATHLGEVHKPRKGPAGVTQILPLLKRSNPGTRVTPCRTERAMSGWFLSAGCLRHGWRRPWSMPTGDTTLRLGWPCRRRTRRLRVPGVVPRPSRGRRMPRRGQLVALGIQPT